MRKIAVDTFIDHTFQFSQEDVIDFARITGDVNPIHLDNKYAKKTIFKQKIIHGFLTGSIFSKIIGTIMPGEGTIYLEQSLQFIKAMYIDVQYNAIVKVIKIMPHNNQAILSTEIFDVDTNKVVLKGTARVLNNTVQWE